MNKLKKTVFFFLLVAENIFASVVFVGMENSKYGFLGVNPGKNYGLMLKHSLWMQDASQYVRLCPFYAFYVNESISGYYAVFAGTTYERGYYDYGTDLYLRLLLLNRILELGGRFRPQYDSDLEFNYGYEIVAEITGWNEVSVFLGVKNIPEYRRAENRIFGGLQFSVKNLKVAPKISLPMNMETQYVRVHVDFLYALDF